MATDEKTRQEGALKFQHAAPTNEDRTLTDPAYLTNWRHGYGLDQPDLYPGTRCSARCQECVNSRNLGSSPYERGTLHCLLSVSHNQSPVTSEQCVHWRPHTRGAVHLR